MFKIGDKIIVASDFADPTSLREYTVSKVNKETLQCNENSELVFYTAFCWPFSVKEELLEAIKERQKLKKAYDDSMTLIYKLRNSLNA